MPTETAAASGARLIDGAAIALAIRAEVARGVVAMRARGEPVPGLATVLIGENPGSATYVRMKRRACADLGIASFPQALPADASQAEVEDLVARLNADPAVNGILVQLPLPGHLDTEAVLARIDLDKDVDGFHPINIGRLAMKDREPRFIPCTPLGILRLLEASGVAIAGADAVVVGRSNIVGLPTALLLNRHDATVTLCHHHTHDLEAHLRRAEILVVAVGRAEIVTGAMIRPGATVIDVGINRCADPGDPRGYRLVGDLDFESARRVAGAITPVPGGVGPMTIAMLMANTLRAAEIARRPLAASPA